MVKGNGNYPEIKLSETFHTMMLASSFNPNKDAKKLILMII